MHGMLKLMHETWIFVINNFHTSVEVESGNSLANDSVSFRVRNRVQLDVVSPAACWRSPVSQIKNSPIAIYRIKIEEKQQIMPTTGRRQNVTRYIDKIPKQSIINLSHALAPHRNGKQFKLLSNWALLDSLLIKSRRRSWAKEKYSKDARRFFVMEMFAFMSQNTAIMTVNCAQKRYTSETV